MCICHVHMCNKYSMSIHNSLSLHRKVIGTVICITTQTYLILHAAKGKGNLVSLLTHRIHFQCDLSDSESTIIVAVTSETGALAGASAHSVLHTV